jgi:hypothetical protein
LLFLAFLVIFNYRDVHADLLDLRRRGSPLFKVLARYNTWSSRHLLVGPERRP